MDNPKEQGTATQVATTNQSPDAEEILDQSDPGNDESEGIEIDAKIYTPARLVADLVALAKALRSPQPKDPETEKESGHPEKIEIDAPYPPPSPLNMEGEPSKKNPSPIKYPGCDERQHSGDDVSMKKLAITKRSKPPTKKDLREKLENVPALRPNCTTTKVQSSPV